MAWKQYPNETLSSSARYRGKCHSLFVSKPERCTNPPFLSYENVMPSRSTLSHILSAAGSLPLLYRGTRVGRIRRCAQQFFTHNRYIGGGAYPYLDALTFNSQH